MYLGQETSTSGWQKGITYWGRGGKQEYNGIWGQSPQQHPEPEPFVGESGGTAQSLKHLYA